MIKLFSLKDQAKTQDGGANRNAKKTTAAQLRITKDISEMDLPKSLRMDIPEDDMQNLRLTVAPDEGDYKGGKFSFSIKISNAYPHEPPKVKCEQHIYHPNIDYEGNVCLNILREDWKPVLTLTSVVYGLQFLFVEPNAEDPLNKEAADLMVRNHSQFLQHVNEAMKGRSVAGLKYDKVM